MRSLRIWPATRPTPPRCAAAAEAETKKEKAPSGKTAEGQGKAQAKQRQQAQQQSPAKRRQEERDRQNRLQRELAKKKPLTVEIPDQISVGELASRMKKTASEVIKQLMKSGVFGGIDGLEALLSEGVVSDYVVYRRNGDRVDGDLRSSNRVATLVIDGVTYDEVRRKSLRALGTVEIRDPSGAPMLNRELYRTFLNQ